jgi:hypothetical protein
MWQFEIKTGAMITLPGITSSWTRNPLEDWDSTRNYHLNYKESTKEIKF